MKRLFVLSVIVLAITACSKDKVETKPHLTFKSFNPERVALGSPLQVTLGFTDEEGDLDSIYVIRRRMNLRNPVLMPPLPFPVPEFNGERKGDVIINLDYSLKLTLALSPLHIPGSNPSANEPDTLQLRFVLLDKAKHRSDTTDPKTVIVTR